jgi:hypothetical protein
MNTTINRPSITVGFKWIEAAFPWKEQADDLKAFNELRTQYRKVQALVNDLNDSLLSLRGQSSQAHKDLAANPGADTIAKTEELRSKLASSEVETKRSIEQLQTNLHQTVRANLPPIAARLNKAIGEWLIQLSSSLEQKEAALAKQYEASSFVPSEIVRAIIYRAGSFYDAARTLERGIMSNISNPDSAMLAIPPENVVAPTKK